MYVLCIIVLLFVIIFSDIAKLCIDENNKPMMGEIDKI